MSDTAESLYIIQCWGIIIMSYLCIFAAAIAFQETTDFGILILAYLPFNFFNHVNNLKSMKIQYGAHADVF